MVQRDENGLGFSIAGGSGSTPLKDGDQVRTQNLDHILFQRSTPDVLICVITDLELLTLCNLIIVAFNFILTILTDSFFIFTMLLLFLARILHYSNTFFIFESNFEIIMNIENFKFCEL